jgi:hypothetical protein
VFIVEVAGLAGAEAEFVVPSPVLALDLALRADRAGFGWQAYDGRTTKRQLTLDELRNVADLHALANVDEVECLRQIAAAEQRSAAAQLN